MPKPVRLPGRPRQKPASAIARKWWATADEYAEVEADAKASGMSVQQYIRWLAIPSLQRTATNPTARKT